MDQETQPNGAAVSALRSPTGKAAPNATKRKGSGTTGHYADPMSPIASTPMKRQRIRNPENTKSTKAKSVAKSVRSEGENGFCSPRKLLDEYATVADDKDADDKTTNEVKDSEKQKSNAVAGAVPAEAVVVSKTEDRSDGAMFSPVAKTSPPIRRLESSGGGVVLEIQTSDLSDSAAEDPNGNAEMFSPTLKLPRLSRSISTSPSSARAKQEAAFHSTASSSSAEHTPEEVSVVSYEESVGSDAGSDASTECEFNPYLFMKTLPKYEDVVEGVREVVLPEKSPHTPKICLVLDLDETLVHCSVEDVENPHLQFPVVFNGTEYRVNVKKRPHMEYFLRHVSKIFEVVVFTASHRAYAEQLLNLLDPHRNLIKYRLYRDDCLDVYGNYLKDLTVLGRPLSHVVLVDNSPHAFGYQVNNGIPIETWYDDEADEELLNLLPFLETLVDADDVRPIVERQFQLQQLIDATPDELV